MTRKDEEQQPPREASEGGERPVKFHVKLTAGATREQALEQAPGILSAIPLFPGEEDQDLAQIYVVEIEANDTDAVVERLEKDPHVEYVERSPKRRLKTPPP